MIVTFTPVGYGETLEFHERNLCVGNDPVLEKFEQLIAALRDIKPNDRSEADRYYAIVITEVEKDKAVYMAYCTNAEGE